MILGAVYMLTLYLKTMYGELNTEKNGDLTDLCKTEIAVFVPLMILVFVMGIYPKPFLDRIEPTVTAYISGIEERLSGDSGEEAAEESGEENALKEGKEVVQP